jgi:hypothetical protein
MLDQGIRLAMVILFCCGGSTLLADGKKPMSKVLNAEWTWSDDALKGFVNMYNPSVIHEPGKEYPFRMWFFGWAAGEANPGYPGIDAVFAARSKRIDGDWQVYAGGGEWNAGDPRQWIPVLLPARPVAKVYDNLHNGDPSVVLKNGQYYMALTCAGYDPRDTKNGTMKFKRRKYRSVCGAVSSDGVTWQKIDKPLAFWQDELAYGYSGSMQKDPKIKNYFGGYARPSLLYDNDARKWKLWFDYRAGQRGLGVAYAENAGDFTKAADWKLLRSGKRPVMTGIMNPNVIKIGKRYYAFGIKSGFPAHGKGVKQKWGITRMVALESGNGVDWRYLGHFEPRDGVLRHKTPEAMLVKEGGDLWLYLWFGIRHQDDPGGKTSNYSGRIRYAKQKINPNQIQ